MAKGIKDAGDRHLMTYHPQGGRSSADWFHNDDWLDFNMLQSGHGHFFNANYEKIAADYPAIKLETFGSVAEGLDAEYVQLAALRAADMVSWLRQEVIRH